MSEHFANIDFEHDDAPLEPERVPDDAPALDDLFAAPPAVSEPEPEPVATASADDQIGRLQIAIGDRDRRIATLNADLDRTKSLLAAATAEAEAGRAACEKLNTPAVKKLFELFNTGHFFIPVPKALSSSQKELQKVVADAAKIYAGASHQPLLQIIVRDISTMQPTDPTPLPPKNRRKIFGVF